MMTRRLVAIATTIAALSWGVEAAARTILPYPCAIPQRVADRASADLIARGNAVQQQRNIVSGAIAAFESICAAVPDDDHAKLAHCRGLQSATDAQIGDYLRDRAALNGAIQSFVGRLDIATLSAIASLDLKIADTRSKIAAFGTQVRGLSTSIEAWANAAEKARQIMRTKALETLMDMLMANLLKRAERAVELEKKVLDGIADRLAKTHLPLGHPITGARARELQFWTVYIEKNAARLAFRMKTKMTDLDVVRALKELLDINTEVEIANAVMDNDGSQKEILNTIAATLKLFVNDPALTLLIDGIELDIALAMLLVTEIQAELRVDQLNSFGKQDRLAIAALAEIYKQQVDARNKLRAQMPPTPAVDANGCPA